MLKNKLALCVVVGLAGGTAAAHASPYVVTLDQVGANIVATGSGDIDLTGLNFVGSTLNDVFVHPDIADLITGTSSSTDVYQGAITGPLSFGSGGSTLASTSSGDNAGLFGDGGPDNSVFVPVGYVSDAALSDSAIYDGATFASLGLTPGIYVWTWGTGADQSFTLEIGQTPIPATLPLFVTGLIALVLSGRRRKRKARADAA